ncbi:hypothetical protein RND71_037541 [Anisodus tanguticus]|uniref:Uncharacterized protein n=1 Tax=Anisodus tanguticus TaxID=243964 RepID=A0AAE1R646_9SOLA|nr:hypothetical protein RND71_037541 [Anisodus tanguticus]
MGKEVAFVHVKKKPMKKKRRNQLFNKVLDYLKSDTFMFAPLYSQSSSSLPHGIGEDKPLEGHDKKLVSKIGDYLKSDDYLYAPLLISPPRDSAETIHVSKVPIQEEMDRKRSADVLKGRTGKADEPGRKTVNVISKDHKMDGFPHTRSPMVARTRVRRETVKHMIYQNC